MIHVFGIASVFCTPNLVIMNCKSSLFSKVAFACLGVASALAAQDAVNVSPPAAKPGKTTEPQTPPLTPTTNPEVQKLLGEAQDLQGRHRYFDALSKLEEAEKLAPTDPNVFNIRGAIYLVPAVRDFEKAKEQFEKSKGLDSTALAPKFNLAELEFVKHTFAEAEAGFASLLKEYPKVPMSVRHLIIFKMLMSQSEQGKFDEANKTLKAHFTFMDDTPAYYFAKAAICFAQKKEDEAKEWIEKANQIFKPAENNAYLDALMETRYVPNIMMAPEKK